MASAVLDASAVLAVLNGEAGAEIVMESLDDAILSAVNYAEVVSKLVERGMNRGQVRAAVAVIDMRVIDFDTDLAERTGELRSNTKKLGLSLADRACLALAEREGATAFTSDRAWRGAISNIEIRVIR
jgi:PIN domain nuclease of toxin-antitoxin system